MTEDSLEILKDKIAAENDQAAFKALYYALHKDLLRLANVFVNQKELAEEVLQDVFTKTWLHRERLSSINNVRVYLYTSVKNAAINYRKKYPLQFLSDPDLSAIKLSYDNQTPEDLMISAEAVSLINHAIELLPPKSKLVFLLVKEDQLKYREVAEILNISIKTVESQMGIALKKVASAIKSQFPQI